MWIFIKYEWKYWLKSPMVWIFLIVITLMVFGAVVSDSVMIGGGTGSVHKNAPFVIQTYYAVMSLIGLLMTTAFIHATANRDFEYGMHPFVFSSPVKKHNYYFGKFIGATTIAFIPLLGVTLGSLIAPLMPWVQASRYGSIVWSGHLNGFLAFAIPNTLIAAVIVYVLALQYRSTVVSFIGSMLILVLYVISSGFTQDIEKEWLANILDPFGFRPQAIVAKYMTVDEKNAQAVPFIGAFLMNRLLWVSLAATLLLAFYKKFSFAIKSSKFKKAIMPNSNTPETSVNLPFKPTQASQGGKWGLLPYLVRFETMAIVKNPTFIILVVIGLMNLVGSITSFTGRYGVDQYPVTYDVIDSIRGSFFMFIIAIITFYSGIAVWKERDAKMNEIHDATPIASSLVFVSKAAAMILATAFVIASSILLGMAAQAASGYFDFQVGVYVKSLLVIDLLRFTYLIIIALLFHYLLNNRYIAYFAFITFVIANQFVWSALKISTNMLVFGSTPSVTYSDMNGFGPFVQGLVWFNVYWLLFSLLIAFAAYTFYIRGKEIAFAKRLKVAGNIWTRNAPLVATLLLLFMGCAGFVYYNTQIVNSYDSITEMEQKAIDYEKTYKHFESLPQPRYVSFNYLIDIEPYKRNMTALVEALVKNKTKKPISEIHFTIPPLSDSVIISISGSQLKVRDNRLGYRIYTLSQPLLPGDSLPIKMQVYRFTKGFENEVSFTQLTQNGTFFNNTDFVPAIGYTSQGELSDKNKREKHKLPRRLRMPKLNEQDSAARGNTYFIFDSDWVDVTTTISTAPDQLAVAPGSLIKQWKEAGKNFFTYKLDHKSYNFYSFISARYEVAREKWNGIDLEVYYHKPHAYNVPSMLRSLRKSLEYYTTNFGPYYHKQCRIIEFPRYASFAQAFPGTMPYSEGIGFITDLRKVTKDDIDLVFYVVAHEMAHQYWAHQFCGAHMQGSVMMAESFAQYSALMVMEKEYGRDKMKKFLKYEMDSYLTGRSREPEAERPLMKVEDQGYIYYQKGSVVMYYLKEMISEQKLNHALRTLIDSLAYKEPPYATANTAMRAFAQVTPDSLKYLLKDLFADITIFSNRVVAVEIKQIGNQYEVTFKTQSEKFKADSLGMEKGVPICDYVDVGVFAEPSSEQNLGEVLALKRVKITSVDNMFTFSVKKKPYVVGIDPYNYLVDRQPEDNLRKPDVF